jgi:hypothetical protein
MGQGGQVTPESAPAERKQWPAIRRRALGGRGAWSKLDLPT